MGYSIVKLYQNTKFYPHQNYKIDNIEEFLTTLATTSTPLTFSQVQYFKPLSLEKELKLTCSQADIKDFHKYNYARIEIKSSSSTTDWILYYFVMKVEWIGIGAVKLHLRMDTLNTFMDTLTFSPRTMVEREHIDRWDYGGYKKDTTNQKITILRYIPYTNEGLNPQKYSCNANLTNFNIVFSPDIYGDRKGMSILYDESGDEGWYCVHHYDSTNKYFPLFILSNESLVNNYYVKHYTDTSSHAMGRIENLNLDMNESVNIVKYPYAFTSSLYNVKNHMSADNPFVDTAITPNYEISSINNPDSANQFYGVKTNLRTSYGFITTPYNIFEYLVWSEFVKGSGSGAVTLVEHKSTAQPLAKHIMCVYDIDYSTLASEIKNNGVFNTNSYSNESSLYSSEFFVFRFCIENTDYNLGLEDLSFYGDLSDFEYLVGDYGVMFSIIYNCSILLGKNYSFQFKGGSLINYDKENSYTNILQVNSNNSVPQFYDNYINYMRNGYNYDVKLRDVDREKRASDYAFQMGKKAEGVITINPFKAVRTATDMAISAAQNKQSEYYTRMSEDLQMEKNLAQLKGSRVDVRDSNTTIELLRQVNKDYKLQLTLDTPHKDFWKTISDYFYYYGNRIRKYKVPTHNNRALFDYLKCKADFINRNNVPNNECLSDIEERLDTGVTFIHKYLNQWTFDTDYKENVENGLLAIL